MQLKKELGKNVQRYRKLNKLTQEKLAELINVEINSISSIERGIYFPSPDNLAKISEVLNISLSDLFNFKEEYSCSEYMSEIQQKLKIISQDKVKLSSVNSFLKEIIV